MKMNDQPGNIVTQFFAWLAAMAAGLGITTQDVVYIIFGLIGVVISVSSFISGRIDARKEHLEDEKRTKILADYLDNVKRQPPEKRPSTAEVVTESMNRINDNAANS